MINARSFQRAFVRNRLSQEVKTNTQERNSSLSKFWAEESVGYHWLEAKPRNFGVRTNFLPFHQAKDARDQYWRSDRKGQIENGSWSAQKRSDTGKNAGKLLLSFEFYFTLEIL